MNRVLLCLLFTLALLPNFVQGQRFVKHLPNSGEPYFTEETPTGFVLGTRFQQTGFPNFDYQLSPTGNLVATDEINLPIYKFIRCADFGFFEFFELLSLRKVVVARYDAQQSLIWRDTFQLQGSPGVNSITTVLRGAVELPNGYVLVGIQQEISPTATLEYLMAAKIDNSGNLVWMEKTLIPHDQYYSRTQPVFSNGFIYMDLEDALIDPTQTYVARVSENGIWDAQPLHDVGQVYVRDLVSRAGGGLLVAYNLGLSQNSSFGGVACFDENWQLLWDKVQWPELDYLAEIGTLNEGRYLLKSLCNDGDGYAMLCAVSNENLSKDGHYLAKLDVNGNILNGKFLQIPNPCSLLKKTSDGGFLFAFEAELPNLDNIGLVKTDSNLQLRPNAIFGKIHQDPNFNCAFDSTESGLKNGLLQLSKGQDTFYYNSNLVGNFEIETDTGVFDLKILPFNPYWEACDNPQTIHFSAENLKDTLAFSLQAIVDCPQMEVDVTLPRARRCFDNPIIVQYCNHGTVAALDASVWLVLDPNLDFVSSTFPLSGTSGDTLVFDLGTVEVEECGEFSVVVNVNCDSTELGETVCISAHIFPDTFCLPLPSWAGGQLIANGICQNDSVVFWVTNIGTGPTQTLEYIIIEDMVIWRQDTFPMLQPGESDTIWLAATGANWALLVEQEPGFPFNNLPFGGVTAWVEGCGWGGTIPFPGGFVTQFPNEDGNPATATDCQTVVGSYDPNDKAASPEGFGNQHFILPGTPLEYLIRFQNTGTDTAFKVVIRDALSPLLDPLSLRLQSASHAVQMEISEDAVLKFTFENILLPDSTTNLEGSQGFVKFSIRMKNDVAIGSSIENTAAIFFDFNPPIYTNTVFHVVDTAFLTSTTKVVERPFAQNFSEQLFSPNPVQRGGMIFLTQNVDFCGEAMLRTATGQFVSNLKFDNGRAVLPAKMERGVYFLSLENGLVGRVLIL